MNLHYCSNTDYLDIMPDYSSLLKRLCQFVKSEAENQRFDLESQWTQPLTVRLKKGLAEEGGMVWESSKQHKTLADALEAAEIAIEDWVK